MIGWDADRMVGLPVSELSGMRTDLLDLLAVVGNDSVVGQKVLGLLRQVEEYLNQSAYADEMTITDEYHFHLPGMALLARQAQQQQQQ